MKIDIELLKRVARYAKVPGGVEVHDLMYRTPAMALREQADAIEHQESDLQKFHEFIEEYEKENSQQ